MPPPLILLPPSEGKATGGSGPPWAPGTTTYPALDASRRKTLAALKRAMRTNATARGRLLGVKGAALAQATATNRDAGVSATMPAIERYTGVLYDALDHATLPARSKRRAADQIVIFSGLWGLVSPTDQIPDYKLKMGASVEPLGRLATWWRPQITAALAPLVGDRTVWDLLPGEHASAWSPPATAMRISVKFIDDVGEGASRKLVVGLPLEQAPERRVGPPCARNPARRPRRPERLRPSTRIPVRAIAHRDGCRRSNRGVAGGATGITTIARVTSPKYQGGILSSLDDIDNGPSRRKDYPKVAADPGLEVTHQASGVIGAVVEWTDAATVIRDDSGRERRVRNMPGGFLVGGRPHTLIRPTPKSATTGRITASGSIADAAATAKVAKASRILVEGTHDAELVEKVWGDDLRSEGIVVQPIDGADDLAEIVASFGPRPGRRLGVLLDHLVDRSKESRIAASIDHPDVLIRGHVFIDIWAAVNPKLIGLDAWPDVPKGMPWKEGICAAVGIEESWQFWKLLLSKVTSYKDLSPSLVGAVEELIDFVADPG